MKFNLKLTEMNVYFTLDLVTAVKYRAIYTVLWPQIVKKCMFELKNCPQVTFFF